MAGAVVGIYVPLMDDKRPLAADSPVANPSRDGDAKPGISMPPSVTTRPPGCRVGGEGTTRSFAVKAKLARFTTATAVLASMALALGAGIGWC